MEGVGAQVSLLQGHAHGWNHIFNYINSMSLKCAVELRIPDIIHGHGGAITLRDLVTASGIPSSRAPALRRLMRLLVHSGFFATNGNPTTDVSGEAAGREVSYLLTDVSTLFLTKSATCMSAFMFAMLDPVFIKSWHFLSTWFRGEEPTPFEVAHGEDVWEVVSRHPTFGNLINEGMAEDARFVLNLVVKECRHVFQGLKSLVDVGGGTGAAAQVIAEAFPHVKCSVLDLPHVANSFTGGSNVVFIAGDMFEHIPPADAILLKWVLHDWNDEDCVKILKRCKEAIPSRDEGGKVIVVEMVVNTTNGLHDFFETQFLFDMHMMAQTEGKQRNEHEWCKVFNDAGFSDYKVTNCLGLRSVIEVYP